MADSRFDSIEEILCPHCRCEQSYFEAGDPAFYSEDTHTYTCDTCGKKFEITGAMTWSWNTEAINV